MDDPTSQTVPRSGVHNLPKTRKHRDRPPQLDPGATQEPQLPVYVGPRKEDVGRLRPATPGDLTFVDHLQKKFGHSLGFLPTAALAGHLELGNVNLAIQNGEPAGYLLGRSGLRWQRSLATIVQAAVAMDAQRRHHGLALLLEMETRLRGQGKVAIQANCAIGVEANEFWAAAGFKPVCHLTPDNVRGREIICWRKALVRNLPAWFYLPPPRAGYRAATTESVRNPHRKVKAVEFAASYLTGRLLPAGDPNAATSPLIRTIDDLPPISYGEHNV